MRTLWKLFLKQVCEIRLPRVLCLPDISNLAASIIDNSYCSHGSKPQMLKHLFKSIYIPVTLQLQYRCDDKSPDKAKGKVRKGFKMP